MRNASKDSPRGMVVGIALLLALAAAVLFLAGVGSAGHWDPGGVFKPGDIQDLTDPGNQLLADGSNQSLYPPERYRQSGLGFGRAVDANGGAATLGHTFVASAPASGNPDENLVLIYRNTGSDSWNFSAAINLASEIPTSEQAVSVDGDNDGDTLAVALKGGNGIAVYKRESAGDWTRTALVDQPAVNVEVSGDLLAYGDPQTTDTYGLYKRTSTGSWTQVFYDGLGSKQG